MTLLTLFRQFECEAYRELINGYFYIVVKKCYTYKIYSTKKENPQQPKAKEKYCAKAIADDEVEFEELLEIVFQKSKLHYADCIRLFMVLEETMNEQLKNGKIIRLGNTGSFQVGITSKGVDSELKVIANTITTAKINFRVGKSFRKLLKNWNIRR